MNVTTASSSVGRNLPIVLRLKRIMKSIMNEFHCGVLDFSAPEGMIIIPSWIMGQMSIQGGDYVSLSRVTEEIQPAESATFQHVNDSFYDLVEDAGACLEICLGSSYTALTKGQILRVFYQGNEFNFVVKELEPERFASLIDSELAVQLLPPPGYTGKEGSSLLKFGGIGGGEIANGDFVPVNLLIGTDEQSKEGNYEDAPRASGRELDLESVTVKLRSETKYLYCQINLPPSAFSYRGLLQFSLSAKVVSPNTGGDFDAYLGSGLITRPTREYHEHALCVNKIGSDEVSFPVDECKSYVIGLRKYESSVNGCKERSFSKLEQVDVILTACLRLKEKSIGEDEGVETSWEFPGQEASSCLYCSNCKEYIPVASFDLHTAFCMRNNYLCEQCGSLVRVSEKMNHWHCDACVNDESESYKPKYCFATNSAALKEKHLQIVHGKYKCPWCRDFVGHGLSVINKHSLEECEERMIECRFCRNRVKAGPRQDPVDSLRYSLVVAGGEHEAYCGSRTAECHICKQNVRLRDMEVHMKLHSFDKDQTPSRRPGETATLMNPSPSASRAWDTAFPSQESGSYAPNVHGESEMMRKAVRESKEARESKQKREIQLCRNNLCNRERWEKSPQKLCKPCLKYLLNKWQQASGDSEMDRTEQSGQKGLFQRLVTVYYNQLTIGCGKDDSCTNTVNCISAKGWSFESDLGFSPNEVKRVAEHCIRLTQQSFDHRETQKYFMCLDREGERLKACVSELVQMGFTAEKCIEALLVTGILDKEGNLNSEFVNEDIGPAAMWLVNNS